MRLSVRCQGGPVEYAGRVWDDVDADAGGYVLFPRTGEEGPEAWYRVDPDEVPVTGSPGGAHGANFVADYLPA